MAASTWTESKVTWGKYLDWNVNVWLLYPNTWSNVWGRMGHFLKNKKSFESLKNWMLILLCFSLFCWKDMVCQIHRVHLWRHIPGAGSLVTPHRFVCPSIIRNRLSCSGRVRGGWSWSHLTLSERWCKMLRSWLTQINFTNNQILFVCICNVNFLLSWFKFELFPLLLCSSPLMCLVNHHFLSLCFFPPFLIAQLVSPASY